MAYDLYPAVDPTYNFPVEVRRALAASPELRSLVIPMTTTTRNNLTAGEKWDGRVIANTTIDRLERYDEGTAAWLQIAEQSDILAFVNTVAIGRNRFQNGDFSVNQRGYNFSTSPSMNSGVVTTYDRWHGQAVGGACVMRQSDTSTNGETGLPESPKSFLRIEIASQVGAATEFVTFAQPIEGVRTLAGKTVTLSFWARASTPVPKKIGVEVEQYFGTTGSAARQTPVGTITVTTSTWVRYSLTFTVPVISPALMGGANDNVKINFWLSAGANYAARASNIGTQNGNFEFWGMQLELGNGATMYEQKTYAEELRACQRYYCEAGSRTGAPGQILTQYGTAQGTKDAVATFQYPVPMRRPPGLSYSGTFFWSDRIANYNVGSLAMSTASASSLLIADINCGYMTPDMVPYRPGAMFGNAPGSVLQFSAEYV